MYGIAAQLAEVLGDGGVVLWEAVESDRQALIMQAIASETPPACIALPESAVQLAKVMAIAAENSWRVLPMGQGSKLSWGGLATGVELVVSTARMNRVIEHAVGDFTVTVEPGLKVADLQRILAEQRQFLAIDPAFDTQATIGGVVATADTGSLRQRYGGLRDMLIGVQFVRHDGELANAGGRVVKNVAGYDLMKLMTGSYGSLGILSELTFRLYPMQACSRSLLLSGDSRAVEAATAEIRLSGLTPVALDVLSAACMARLTAVTPSQPVGSDQVPQVKQSAFGSNSGSNSGGNSLVARFQGIEAGVQEQLERLRTVATMHGMDYVQLEGEADEAFWQQSARVINADAVLCKVGLRPTGIPWLIELADKVMPGAQVRLYGSSGLGWIQFEPKANEEDSLVSGLMEVRSHCQKNAGFLTILQAPKSVKLKLDVWGYSGNALSVMRDIKQKFDPQQRLSPSRFVGGL